MMWVGRGQVRATLYIAVVVATHYNLVIKTLYQRLWEMDKAKKIARIACMRKLLTILSSMLNHPTP